MSTLTGPVVQRASGIVVPAASLDKKPRTLTNDDFVKLMRVFRVGREHGWLAMFFCTDCKEPVQIRQRERLVTEVTDDDGDALNAPGGRYSLACGCSVWSVL